MGLINSEGNYLVITDVEMHHITVQVFATKEKAISLDPNFEKPDVFGIHLPNLKQALKDTSASGTGGKKIWDNILTQAETQFLALVGSPEATSMLPQKSYPQDWVVESV